MIGIYWVIGVCKTLALSANANPALKPLWMTTERYALFLAVAVTFHALLWPLAGPGR
jgi:hypothetical protein